MQTALRKMGNSTGLVVPKAMLAQLGLASGARMNLSIENGGIVARAADADPRAGWDEAAARIAATPLTQEERDWLEASANDMADMADAWTW